MFRGILSTIYVDLNKDKTLIFLIPLAIIIAFSTKGIALYKARMIMIKISEEVKAARKTFKKYKWPVIDVTRKSVEETAASIIKIYEIYKEHD